MRRFQLSYATALNLARESRPRICPNNGFEKQLRVWEFCRYSIYRDSDGSTEEIRKEKPPYKAWKAERDNLLQKGEEHVNRARFFSLADMAAKFGRRRQELSGSGEGGGKGGRADSIVDGEELGRSLGDVQRREAWERVQRMESEWNDRLMRGEVGGRGTDGP
jgi:hypothetical protein